LAQLDAIEEGLLDTTLANIDTLAVFQTSGRDARELVWELGDENLKARHVVNLPEHTCFLKTQRDGIPLPVMRVDLMDADVGDERTTEALWQRCHRYTVDAAEAERRHREHVKETYEMDLGAFERQMDSWRRTINTAQEEQERKKTGHQPASAGLRSESEGTGKGARQPPPFSAGTPASAPIPEELEKPRPKHTRSRRRDRDSDR
jgi:hypothetical protein